MGATHIPVADAARILPDLLDRARAGEEIVIDDGSATPVRLAPASPRPKPVSAVIARLQAIEKDRGQPLRMGAAFADDMEEIVNQRKPRDTSEWD